jgi:hypothetical protein
MLIAWRQATLFIEFASREKKNFSSRKKSFFSQLFNLMKWSRLTSSLFLASFVLVSILSLFEYCLSSFSSSLFSWSFSSSVSSSFSFPSSVRDWISLMNSKHCFRIHRLIWQSRLHLHAFELRELSSCWIFERSFSCSSLLHLCISMKIYLRISMIHLHLLQVLRRWSSIFRFEETIAWSYDLRILYNEKRINWKNISVEFTS